MLNRDIKQQFIDNYSNNEDTKSSVKTCLNGLGKVEDKYQQDLFNMSYDIIADNVLNLMKINSYRTYHQYMMVVRHYKDWCLLNNKFSNGATIAFENVSDVKLKEKYAHYIGLIIFRSFEDLHQYIDDIFYIDHSSNNMLRFDFFKMVILLLYQGIVESSIFTLTVKDIQIMDNGIFIIHDNKITKIEDKELAVLLKKRCSTQYYEMNKGRRYDLVPLSEYLIDFGAGNPDKTKINVKEGISRLTSDYNKEHHTDKKIEYYNIYAYGMIRKIKIEEVLNNRKMKKKEIYQYFAQNNNGIELETRGRKQLVREIYHSW